MKSQLWWKWLVVAGFAICSLWLALPPELKIRLGLDLRGGYSFTVELDKAQLETTVRDRMPEGSTEQEIANRIKTAMETADDTAVEIIRNRIDAIGTEEPVITKGSNGRIYVQMPGASDAQRDRAEKLIKSIAFLDFRLVSPLSGQKAQKLLEKAAQNRDRGAANPYVPAGFKIAENLGSRFGGRCYVRDPAVPEPDLRKIRSFGQPDAGYVFMLEKESLGQTEIYYPIYTERRARLTGDTLLRAGTEADPMKGMTVTLRFNNDGAKKFADITTRFCRTQTREGRQMAIVLDDLVYSAPVLNEPITGGSAVITGRFSLEEAAQLKNVLNAGAMPAPLKFLGRRFVNPTLGEDSIADARMAILVGCAGVLLFMFLYYRRLGLVADLALLMNFVLLPVFAVASSGILSQISGDATLSGGSILRLPVLTLPGIAGILLTVGMAVDANVLIYERIREEVKRGKTAYPAIMAGYDRAFSAIFDGNVTTVITGAILFVVGTGLIRGFAVTLVAGIIASMFTALLLTKIVFQTFVSETSTWKIGMMQAVRDGIDIPFTKNFKKFAVLSVVVVVATVGTTVARGLKNPASIFDVDFTGGKTITYSVSPAEEGGALPAPEALTAAAREALVKAGIDDASVQIQTEEDKTFVEVKTVYTDLSDADGKALDVSTVMQGALADAEDEVLGKLSFVQYADDTIGSQIGKEMRDAAFWAIALAVAAMLVYIGFRFKFGFGLGAIVALAHDVLVTVGVFSCLGFQFNLTVVAALLTIVGYGVNDTVVLFDRVREEIKRDQKTDFPAIVNRCVNLTLSRTVLTSVTTLIPVVALVVFCSGSIQGFGVCMLIGVVVSTLSSIFIASPVMLAWYHGKRPDFREAR